MPHVDVRRFVLKSGKLSSSAVLTKLKEVAKAGEDKAKKQENHSNKLTILRDTEFALSNFKF